ncbi:PilW family protein [Mangrovitalea sediminis]|uniref:PilW family protein n=1 Tax=Mangrovitalea sediminis TaxID=1982043 RepID=UPI000BE5ECA4|nr:PilW family protein [Mangrovitalea sediminis]
MKTSARIHGNRCGRQSGLSLISVMIAILLSTFLLLILFTIWQSTRGTFSTENSLSDLQGSERLALTVAANTVHMAGYYPVYLNYQTPAPASPYSTNDFAASGSFAIGQVISGTHAAAAPGDTLSVRFIADSNVNTLDCLGQAETTGTLVTNTFSVSNSGDFQCSVNGKAPETIVSGVKAMTVLYGVDTTGSGSALQYLPADQLSSKEWSLVNSVKLALTFDNPLAGQAGQNSTLPPIHSVLALMQNVR